MGAMGNAIVRAVEQLRAEADAANERLRRFQERFALDEGTRNANLEPYGPSVWTDPNGRRIRMSADNVLVLLKPLDEQTAAGVVLVRDRKTVVKEPRIARVLAVGPGYHVGCSKCGVNKHFVPTTVRQGDEVLVPFLAGADWSLDRSKPRHLPAGVEFAIHDERHNNYGESDLIGDLRLSNLRICKEEELIGVIEP